jgi:hypothetical protein
MGHFQILVMKKGLKESRKKGRKKKEKKNRETNYKEKIVFYSSQVNLFTVFSFGVCTKS